MCHIFIYININLINYLYILYNFIVCIRYLCKYTLFECIDNVHVYIHVVCLFAFVHIKFEGRLNIGWN